MTGRATVLGLIAIATFFAAVNVQAGWLYVLADAFIGFLVGTLGLAFLTVRGIHVTARAESLVEQGTPLRVAATIENRGLMARGFVAFLVPGVGRRRLNPATWFRLVPHGWAVEVVPSLAAHAWSEINLAAATPRRGVFPTPPVVVQAAPLGLFFWRKRVPVPGEVVVTPRVLHLEGLPWFRPDARGGEEHPMARTVPHGEMIRSTRDYRSGDPLRTIHWRGTARVGRLVVKETEGTAIAGGAVVLLDLGGHTETGLEHAIQVAASILAHLYEQGIAARLITQMGEVGESLAAQLEALARARESDESLARYLADLDPAGLIVISPRDQGWRSVASYWIQAGAADSEPLAGAIHCPAGSDVSAVLLAGRAA